MKNTENGRLCLTRRPSESIYIEPDILIEVTGVHGNQVRLTIIAPKTTRIVRTELLVDDEKHTDSVSND